MITVCVAKSQGQIRGDYCGEDDMAHSGWGMMDLCEAFTHTGVGDKLHYCLIDGDISCAYSPAGTVYRLVGLPALSPGQYYSSPSAQLLSACFVTHPTGK